MQVNHWGPHAWSFFHAVTFNYPENPTEAEKKHYRDYFHMLPNVLPCKLCQDHYRANLRILPVEPFLDNRYSLTYWLFVMHNIVNVMLKKPKTLCYRDVVRHYEAQRARCGKITEDNAAEIKTCQVKAQASVTEAFLDAYCRKVDPYRKKARDILSSQDKPLEQMLCV